MSYAIITEVHTLDDALFEKVFMLAAQLLEVCGMKPGKVFGNVAKDAANRRRSFKRHVRKAGLDAGLNARSFRMTHNTWPRLAGLDDMTIGTLRRDKGSGSALLRRWNYSDPIQLLPYLRGELARVEAWHGNELKTKARQA